MIQGLTKKATFGVVLLGAVLLDVPTVGSQNAQVKVWRDGDTLTAADLNASFIAAQANQQPQVPAQTAATYAWSAFAPVQQGGGAPSADGHVGRFTFSSPVDGFVWVNAHYEIRVRNSFDSTKTNCRVESLLDDRAGFSTCAAGESCTLEGYSQNSINSNLPTQDSGGGVFFGLSETVSRVMLVARGVNTFYLNGRTDCAIAYWGAITMSALFVQNSLPATIAIP